MRSLFLIAAAASCLAGAPWAHAAELTDAAVAQALGASGVQHTAKARERNGMRYTDFNYESSSGQLLLSLRVADPVQYGFWKQAVSSGGGSIEMLAGVGTEAFKISQPPSYCAKTDSTAACVTPGLTPPPGLRKLSETQWLALLKAAL
jgi:hypothetical protein